MPALSEPLQRGREALTDSLGVAVLSKWQWLGAEQGWGLGALGQGGAPGAWALRLRLTLTEGAALPTDTARDGAVPTHSDWYLLAEEAYPFGRLGLWPARDSGITQTFPHQLPNLEHWRDQPGLPFRAGRISVTGNYQRDRVHGDSGEPFQAEARLAWYAQQGRTWLNAAAVGALQHPGDPPWLPMQPRSIALQVPTLLGLLPAGSVACWEGSEHLPGWEHALPVGQLAQVTLAWHMRSGTLLLHDAPGLPAVEREAQWGAHLMADASTVLRGLLLRLRQQPWLPPCRLPETWGELRAVLHAQNLSLDELLRAAPLAAAGRGAVPLLLAAPIPRYRGGPPARMHLETVVLPHPAHRGEDAALHYLPTGNWHPAQLEARGQLEGCGTQAEVLLLGAGSLGSAVAELLVRGGVRRVLVCDPDHINLGNLLRHTATLDDLGLPKALVLAARLQALRPGVSVHAHPAAFLATPQDVGFLGACEVIVDCTADDEVIDALARYPWPSPRLFVSLSLAATARRLYLYTTRGAAFPSEDFRQQMSPLLAEDRGFGTSDAVHAGEVGCQSPSFVARADQVWALAAGAMPVLARALQRAPGLPTLHVITPPQALPR